MQEYNIKGNGGIGMLSAEEIIEQYRLYYAGEVRLPTQKVRIEDAMKAMRIYRNQGIEQASEVCCETLTDGFRISNIPAVLALKEEV